VEVAAPFSVYCLNARRIRASTPQIADWESGVETPPTNPERKEAGVETPPTMNRTTTNSKDANYKVCGTKESKSRDREIAPTEERGFVCKMP